MSYNQDHGTTPPLTCIANPHDMMHATVAFFVVSLNTVHVLVLFVALKLDLSEDKMLHSSSNPSSPLHAISCTTNTLKRSSWFLSTEYSVFNSHELISPLNRTLTLEKSSPDYMVTYKLGYDEKRCIPDDSNHSGYQCQINPEQSIDQIILKMLQTLKMYNISLEFQPELSQCFKLFTQDGTPIIQIDQIYNINQLFYLRFVPQTQFSNVILVCYFNGLGINNKLSYIGVIDNSATVNGLVTECKIIRKNNLSPERIEIQSIESIDKTITYYEKKFNGESLIKCNYFTTNHIVVHYLPLPNYTNFNINTHAIVKQTYNKILLPLLPNDYPNATNHLVGILWGNRVNINTCYVAACLTTINFVQAQNFPNTTFAFTTNKCNTLHCEKFGLINSCVSCFREFKIMVHGELTDFVISCTHHNSNPDDPSTALIAETTLSSPYLFTFDCKISF